MGLTVIWSMHLYFYELSSPEVIKNDDDLNDPLFKISGCCSDGSEEGSGDSSGSGTESMFTDVTEVITEVVTDADEPSGRFFYNKKKSSIVHMQMFKDMYLHICERSKNNCLRIFEFFIKNPLSANSGIQS